MKKIILTVGSFMAVAAPISAAVSCGNSGMKKYSHSRNGDTSSQTENGFYTSSERDPYLNDPYVAPNTDVVTPITQINTEKLDEYKDMVPTVTPAARNHFVFNHSESSDYENAGRIEFNVKNYEALKQPTTIGVIAHPDNVTDDNQSLWVIWTKLHIEALDQNGDSLGEIFTSKKDLPAQQLANYNLIQYNINGLTMPEGTSSVKVWFTGSSSADVDTNIDLYVGHKFTKDTIQRELAIEAAKLHGSNSDEVLANDVKIYKKYEKIYEDTVVAPHDRSKVLGVGNLRLENENEFNVFKAPISRELLSNMNAMGYLSNVLNRTDQEHYEQNLAKYHHGVAIRSIKIKDPTGKSIFETKDHKTMANDNNNDFDFYTVTQPGQTSVFEFAKNQFASLKEGMTDANKNDKYSVEITMVSQKGRHESQGVLFVNSFVTKEDGSKDAWEIQRGSGGEEDDITKGVNFNHVNRFWGRYNSVTVTRTDSGYNINPVIDSEHKDDWWLAKNYLGTENQGAETSFFENELKKEDSDETKLGKLVHLVAGKFI